MSGRYPECATRAGADGSAVEATRIGRRREGDAPGLGSCTAGGRREPLGHGRHGLTKVRKDARDEAAATLQVRRIIVEFQENGFFGGAREESNVELREDDDAGCSPHNAVVPQLELLEEWEALLGALHISLFC